MKEFKIAGGASARFGSDKHRAHSLIEATQVIDLADVEAEDLPRIIVGIEEFDRVMGGGLVPGGVSLIGGDPGIGKSTLLLQVMSRLVAQGKSALYVSGEESAGQVAMRAKRLGIEPHGLSLMSEIELEKIEEALLRLKPEFIVIDSIQTLFPMNWTAPLGASRRCANARLGSHALPKPPAPPSFCGARHQGGCPRRPPRSGTHR